MGNPERPKYCSYRGLGHPVAVKLSRDATKFLHRPTQTILGISQGYSTAQLDGGPAFLLVLRYCTFDTSDDNIDDDDDMSFEIPYVSETQNLKIRKNPTIGDLFKIKLHDLGFFPKPEPSFAPHQ